MRDPAIARLIERIRQTRVSVTLARTGTVGIASAAGALTPAVAAVRPRSARARRCRSAGAFSSIAGVNAAVVLVLAGLIWNGAQDLSRAWDDVRKVRESDSVLALLESEAGRLQNLIHRYINQPSPQIFAEILLLREAVLGTLGNRGAIDPMLAGSVDELERATERFLAGFGDLRAEQTAIARAYEDQVLAPAREMAGLYAIIDGAIGRRDALIWPSLGKSREAFSATLVAANAYYLSLASEAAEEARNNIETIEIDDSR